MVKTDDKREVIIEDFVWIGANVTILPGSHIHEGSIIGAGCTVSGNVKSGSVLSPVRPNVICERNLDLFKKLKNKRAFK